MIGSRCRSSAGGPCSRWAGRCGGASNGRPRARRCARRWTLFHQTGASLWAHAARNEVGRAGERNGEPGELTATERHIAELAASGLSNQEVAERAFLTVKGVEANLTRAYRKLGIRSRGGLAGALRRRRRAGRLKESRFTLVFCSKGFPALQTGPAVRRFLASGSDTGARLRGMPRSGRLGSPSSSGPG